MTPVETFFITVENKTPEHIERIEQRISELNLALSKGRIISNQKWRHSDHGSHQ
jgi:hypothetical protein